MRQIVLWACVFAMVGSLTAGRVQAADLRIGVVDVQRVIKESQAGRDATRKLRHKQDERSSDIQNRKAEIAVLQKSIESLDPVVDKEAREKKKAELAVKIEAMKDMDSRFNGQLRDINTKQSSSVKSDVLRVIDQVGRKGGFFLIIDKNDALFSAGASDVTSQVIEEYDMELQRDR